MADKKNLNDQLPADLRRRRHNKAKNYRELYLLPRFVVEEGGEKRKLEVKDRTFCLLTRLGVPLLPLSRNEYMSMNLFSLGLANMSAL